MTPPRYEPISPTKNGADGEPEQLDPQVNFQPYSVDDSPENACPFWHLFVVNC